MEIQFIYSALIGYLFGCIQASYFIGKLIRKIDIREHGTANAGASNVTMVMGFKWGMVTGFVDVLKAMAAVWVVQVLYPASAESMFVAGTFAVLGHIYPFFLKFKGGKGIASLIGMFLAMDLEIGLWLLLIQVAVSLVTDYVAVGSLLLYISLPLFVYFSGYPPLGLVLSMVLTAIGLYKHYPNLTRIISRKEPRVRAVLWGKK